jgi:hypothetical protein
MRCSVSRELDALAGINEDPADERSFWRGWLAMAHRGNESLKKYRIYISSPADANLAEDQLKIKTAVLDAIKNEGFDPQEFLRRGIPRGMPWSYERADDVMSRCQGAAILAFARWRVTRAGPEEQAERFDYLPSEYNHFEGALAYSHHLPLLVITDRRIRTSGITLLSEVPVIYWPEDRGPDWVSESRFKEPFDGWVAQVLSRGQVFLGYCSAARDTADDLRRFMQKAGVRVWSYEMDFLGGRSILEQIDEASHLSSCGIFLFTKDDALEGQVDQAAPRDNVVFEAGFFSRAMGKGRTLIIREEGAKMPADLGGSVYLSLKDRRNISSIRRPLRRFLEHAL